MFLIKAYDSFFHFLFEIHITLMRLDEKNQHQLRHLFSVSIKAQISKQNFLGKHIFQKIFVFLFCNFRYCCLHKCSKLNLVFDLPWPQGIPLVIYADAVMNNDIPVLIGFRKLLIRFIFKEHEASRKPFSVLKLLWFQAS